MLDISKDIDSLSSFKRNTPDFIRQMKETGRPVVLTVNGKAELVVQDAASYQKLLELVDRLEAIEAVREGLRELEEGKGLSLEEAMQSVRERHGISL